MFQRDKRNQFCIPIPPGRKAQRLEDVSVGDGQSYMANNAVVGDMTEFIAPLVDALR